MKEDGMAWIQQHLRLTPRRRGFHLITTEVEAALPDLERVRVGLLHVFLQHTSASLCLNENADPDVPRDLELAFNEIAREDFAYAHTAEGPDDMPAHVKSAMLGAAVSVPIASGRLCLGTWQGIYLCEHRDHGGPRRLVLTLQGETA
jgi:secondary thiamine-phosphate synthase enzyme